MTRDKETTANHRGTSPSKLFSSCLDAEEPFISPAGFRSTFLRYTAAPFSPTCLFRWSLIQISAGQTAACVCSLLMPWQANLRLSENEEARFCASSARLTSR